MTPIAAEAFESLQRLRALYDEKEGEAQEIRDIVNKASYSIELRALPKVIVKDARRRAKKTLGLTGQSVPADQEDALEDEVKLEILVDQIQRFRDNSTGEERSKLSLDRVRGIVDFLPEGQSDKLVNAAMALQFQNVISEEAIAQADF